MIVDLDYQASLELSKKLEAEFSEEWLLYPSI